jgi:hypothetical protein
MKPWSDERLRKLFDHYNRLYWRGQLSGYRVVLADLSKERAWGHCEWKKKIIRIDQHSPQLRGTLLHEMAHAASRSGHTVPFFAQLERLLKRGAPVTVEASEAGDVEILSDVVPKRFPLLRAKMQRAEKRRASQVLRFAREKKLKTYTMTDDMIARRFANAAMEMTWKPALVSVGLQHGLTDESGRPLNAWARRVIRAGRRAYRRARRDYLEYEHRCRQLAEMNEGRRPDAE